MRVVVLGTGLAGYMFAKEWRKLDAESELVFITASMGHFYSKPLLSTAFAQSKAPADLIIKTASQMAEELNATVLTQTLVTQIDPKMRTVFFQSQALSYDVLILALGAEPVLPELPELTDLRKSDYVMSVNQWEDYDAWRAHLALGSKKRVAVIGSGLVGAEFVNDLSLAKYELSWIGRHAYPLAHFVPEPMGRLVLKTMQAAGVQWLGDQSLLALKYDQEADKICLRLKHDIGVTADAVLHATGITPSIQLAKAAGLKTGRGVVVDTYLRTSDPHIYALGDCVEYAGRVYQYVAPILLAARALAATVTGKPISVVFPPMPIVVKTSRCPLVVMPPELTVSGSWRYEGDEPDCRALFYDIDGRLRGFVLSGRLTQERQRWLGALG
jgi:rubredoxin-NAD+ reductase